MRGRGIIDWDMHLERLISNIACLHRERPPTFEGFLDWCDVKGHTPHEVVRRLVEPHVRSALSLMALGQGGESAQQQQQPHSDVSGMMLVVIVSDKQAAEGPSAPCSSTGGGGGASTGGSGSTGGGGGSTSTGGSGSGSTGGSGGSTSTSTGVSGGGGSESAGSPSDEPPLSVAVYCKALAARTPLETDAAVKVVARGCPRQWAHAKHCEWVLQRRELEAARPPDAAEVVLLDDDGTGLLEGLASNFYVIAEAPPAEPGPAACGGSGDLACLELQTAHGPGRRALSGIMQRRVLEAARGLGLRVRDGPPRCDERGAWREAFISNCIKGLQPVNRLAYWRDGPAPSWEHTLPCGGRCGRVTRMLRERVEELQQATAPQDLGCGTLDSP